MSLKEELIRRYDLIAQNNVTEFHSCNEGARQHHCSKCNKYFCTVWCWFDHLFQHWKMKDDVTGWYDIK